MIDELELQRDLSRATLALERAEQFLDRYDEAHAALLGMAPGWDSPLALTVRDGRMAIARVAAYIHALVGEAEGVDGAPVRRLVLIPQSDPGE